MKIVHTVDELNQLPAENRGAVFTMGALHEGHVALMRRCREEIGDTGLLIVTIFVNPTQFNDPKDLERYPRNLDADIAVCEAAGVDVVFAPSVEEMYPGEVTSQSAGALGTILEGKSRPGHFDAVATVVYRLLEITKPQVTCFGEKDFQQLAVVRTLVRQTQLPVNVIGVETVRESDGLAKSSRNQLLTSDERAIASLFPQALFAIRDLLAQGVESAQAIAEGSSALHAHELIAVDYIVVMANDLSTPANTGDARLLAALKIGNVRLIDNMAVTIASSANRRVS